jgi:hypothetical protein
VDVAEPAELIVRSLEDPSVFVRLYDRFFIDQDGTGFFVEAQADGLRACVGPVEVSVWDRTGLPGFLTRLAENFRGWNGERTWHNNDLKVQAVFYSGGHVAVTWMLQPWNAGSETWRASVTTWVEAGAQMSTLADDMHAFLPSPRTRSSANQ